ncbi:MAG TPA: HEAT repeat domain-containing protein [Pirellulales bacterium]|jgi:HEAT repeat protein|nr:HEAT repeat domain-containing protein [Pirellulales bacterium]
MLEDSFEALTKYDWGTDRAVLAPIEDAVAAAHGNAEVQKKLEVFLVSALKSDISRDAKDYVCRKLAIVGTAFAVPTLAPLLAEENHSHMARFALERMPAAEAAQALRDALSKTSGNLQIGIISSVGARRDAAAVPALGQLIKDSNASTARAAATALADIGNVAAAQALQNAKPSAEARQAVIDAQLTCAEALLAENNAAQARRIYQALSGGDQPKLVRLAATRGMLACAAKNA